MRRRQPILTIVLPLALILGAFAADAGGTPAKPIRVTFIGDSVPASLDYVSSARRILAKGMTVKLDLRVCRRLATTSCPYNGVTPSTALESVVAAGRSIGDVLVIDVGYNEDSFTYRSGMTKIIRAARKQGVEGIVWLTLRETQPVYRSTNGAIRAEAKRWPFVYLVDWNTYSAGRPWFRDDGLHLNTAGADGLALVVRANVLRAVNPPTKRP